MGAGARIGLAVMRALTIFLLLFSLFYLSAETKGDYRGRQFIGFERFDEFSKSETEQRIVLVSDPIKAAFRWDELVASWNFRAAPSNTITVEAKAIYQDRETKWYTLAKWSLAPQDQSARASVKGQKDENGRVDTDILKLKEAASDVQLRITIDKAAGLDALKFLGLSFCDSAFEAEALPGKKSAWGKTLQVKERSQASYPEGINEWCSPTSISMLMSFWANKLERRELDYDVPEVARGVNDPNWPGTGNWPFNTAFVGAHNGMRAYVTRLSDVSELEDWVEAGIPVAVSVAYGYLKGKPERANGHLVVCIGFDESGNIVVNDPGRSQVRQVYARENLVKAWAESENTVYIVHPENWKVPEDRFGHWHK